MSVQLISLLTLSLMAGFGGSLHCVGMCGGLVTASCEKSNDIFRYQIGRLIGYLCLGAFAGMLGSFLEFKVIPQFSFVTAIMIGVLFIYWGIQNFRGKKAEMPTPKFFGKIYTKLWMSLVQRNKNFTKALFTGFISILLPCGLLYGVVLGTVALQNIGVAMFSMFFFWLGTFPSMVMAPGVVQKFLRPLRAKLPKTYAVALMMIGVLTISFRVLNQQDKSNSVPAEKVHRCH